MICRQDNRKEGKEMIRNVGMMVCVMLIGSAVADAASLRFSRHFGDGMVLQRDQPVTIRGIAIPEQEVVVRFGAQEQRAMAGAQGDWEVTLDPMAADRTGQALIGQVVGVDTDPVVLQDVVVGDVFLVGRQTTIDISLGRDAEGRATAAAHPINPYFRAISIQTIPSGEPQSDLARDATTGWGIVDADMAARLSAAAYHLGQKLIAAVDVPIGIMDVNLGPHFPVAWLSRDQFLRTGDYFDADQFASLDIEHHVEHNEERYLQYTSGEKQAEWDERHEVAAARAADMGLPAPTRFVATNPVQDPHYPAAGYHAVLHPLRGLALKGLLLQQGNDYPYLMYERLVRDGTILDRAALGLAWRETNTLRRRGILLQPVTTPRLVPAWRAALGNARLPVGLIVPSGSELATAAILRGEMRELQRRVADEHDAVGLIMPGMESIPFSAQPADEELLAARSFRWLLHEVYGQDAVIASGPRLERLETAYATAQLFFQPGTADGLSALPGGLDLFEAAGADGIFHPAEARIDGETVRIESDHVNRIVHVRYNWGGNPSPGLVNAADLPAIPFRTDMHRYPEAVMHTEDDLPMEYTTPASEWEDGDVAIISGSLDARNWTTGEGWLGATGLRVGPFGPNMSVLQVLPDSPAEGKIFPGDLIYAVNDRLLGDDPLRRVSYALTQAESEAGGGVIRFGLRRAGRNQTVALELEVLGTYSPTAPYDCPKTDRIVANLEAFLAARDGEIPNRGGPGGFLGTDALFLLAAGTPEHQGLVRRVIYARMAAVDLDTPIDPMQPNHPQGWFLGANALLASEYYLATGDRNVLPYLAWWCDYLAMAQVKEEEYTLAGPPALPGQAGGWRHNWHGGQHYGLLPAIGLPAMLGLHLAREAGVDIDEKAYDRGIAFLRHNGVEVGSVFYGWQSEPVTTPTYFTPADLKAGMLSSNNGAISMAAILFDLKGEERVAHLCSFISTFAYNNTHIAHGGNFWSNFWTPLGANMHGRDAFIHFMQGHRWYRELNRLSNHSYYQGNTATVGAGQMLALLVPRQRLRILGAPASVFSANPVAVLEPALEAYYQRDYRVALERAEAVLADGSLSVHARTQARQLRDAARDMQASIAHDLDKVEGLLAAGKWYEARLDLPQLEGVMAADDPRLQAVQDRLADPAAESVLAADRTRYEAHQRALRFTSDPPSADAEEEERWRPLLTELALDGNTRAADKDAAGEATAWRLRILEGMSQAPADWFEPAYDDSDWMETELPISWHINHTALARATFDVEDKDALEALRLRMWVFRQQDIAIYLNGTLIAKVNQASNNQWLEHPLTDGALAALRNGKNTVAVTTRNNWRWGTYFRHYETDFDSSVLNGGVSVLIDGKAAAASQ